MDHDDEAHGLISDLLARAGMLMENFSVNAVSSLPKEPVELRHRIREIALGGAAIGMLTFAAWCLSQRSQIER